MNFSKDENTKRRKQANSKKVKTRNKTGVIAFRIALAAIIIAGFAFLGIAFGAYMGIIENAPQIIDDYYDIYSKNYTSIVYDQYGNEIDRYKGDENREYVSLDKIPEHLQHAFVAIEDERFYSHNGIDMKSMVRALYSTVIKGDKQGASTITQQLIKNNIANVQRNTLTTKIQEQYLAVKYEKQLVDNLGSKELAKEFILEDYLNTIALSHGLNGVQTAAQYYFGVDVSELTIAQSAVIAAITQRPTDYSPVLHPENNRKRQETVLYKMLELEFITEAEYEEALEEDVYSGIQKNAKIEQQNHEVHDYYSDQLIEELIHDLVEQKGYTRELATHMIYNGGLRIYTPKDEFMTNILNETFLDDSFFSANDYEIDLIYDLSVKNTISGEQEHYSERKTVNNMDEANGFKEEVKDMYLTANKEFVADKLTANPQPQAAMVIIDYHNGHVKAIVGGRGEKTTNRGFNRATQSKRQPGSVFKILASYAPAVDMDKVGAGSIVMDEPFFLPDGTQWPRNWNNQFKGPSTIREGIYNSMNVVTVRNMDNAGVDACFDYLKRFGITTLVDGEERNGKIYSDRGLATGLGGLTDGVTQLEVAAAFGTIANNGVYQKPVFYTKVLDHEGKILLENNPEENRQTVLKETSAYILTDMMKDVVTRGTGTRAKLQEVNMPVAGKTGTSQNTKDLTFVGYTPYYVSSIWLGYDTEKVMREDRSYHMNIWRHVMEEVHRNLEYRDFSGRPAGVVNATLCIDSGKLPVKGVCDSIGRTNSDIFAVNAVPTDYCDVHGSIVIDIETGELADENTPPDRRRTVIGNMKDGKALDWEEEEEIDEEELEGEETIIDPETGLALPSEDTPVEGSPEQTPPTEEAPVETPPVEEVPVEETPPIVPPAETQQEPAEPEPQGEAPPIMG